MSFSTMVTDYIVEFILNENALALDSLIGTELHLLATTDHI
jgi:hypothetical protein